MGIPNGPSTVKTAGSPLAFTAFLAFFTTLGLPDFILRGFFAFFFTLVVFFACERVAFFFVFFAAFVALEFLLDFFALRAISVSPLGHPGSLSSRNITKSLWRASVKSTKQVFPEDNPPATSPSPMIARTEFGLMRWTAPLPAFGNVKADVIADNQSHFHRGNFCSVIRGTAWRG